MSPLARLLATEQEVVYLLGVLGARAEGASLVAGLRAAYAEHVAAREDLTQRILAGGGTPPAPAVGYAVPAGWHGDAALRRAAVELEERATAAYVGAVGDLGDAERRWAAEQAGLSAVRAVLLGGGATPLPGLRPSS